MEKNSNILNKENLILFVVLVSYLSSLSEYIGNLRNIITIISTLLLGYIFLKRFGLKIVDYPKIPSILVYFISLFILNLIFSSLYASNISLGFSAVFNSLGFFCIVYLSFALISNENTVIIYIISIVFSVVIIAFRIYLDVSSLGVNYYFMKSILDKGLELSGSAGYTGFTIFFISSIFLLAFYFMDNISLNTKKYVLSILMVINIFALIFANSRSAIISFILGIVYFSYNINRKTTLKFFSIVIILFFFLFIIFQDILEIFDFYLRFDKLNQRTVFWDAGIEMIADNPLMGVGPGNFYSLFYSYASSHFLESVDINLWMYGHPTAHNLYLNSWAETGLIGFLLSTIIFVIFFNYSIKATKLSKGINNNFYLISISITGIGLGYLFRSFFEVTGVLYYGFISTDFPFWLLLMISIYITQKIECTKD